MNEAYDAADEMIKAFAAKGYDCSSFREAIARGFLNGLFQDSPQNWNIV